jgi:uncharacterized protein with PIN domain
MTHMGPMKESEGTFTLVGDSMTRCRACERNTMHTVQQWDSNCGGYEDFKYTCNECGKVHWVDGIDS